MSRKLVQEAVIAPMLHAPLYMDLAYIGDEFNSHQQRHMRSIFFVCRGASAHEG